MRPPHLYRAAAAAAGKPGLRVPELEYLSTIIYNIEIGRTIKNSNQWIYFLHNELCFIRISFPRDFDKNNVPAGKYGTCLGRTATFWYDNMENP